MILEGGEVRRARDSSGTCRLGKLLVVAAQLVTNEEALLIFGHALKRGLFGQLRTTCLHREVGLPQGDDGLLRISILHDEVAGVTGEVEIIHLTLCARTNCNHIADLSKMVRDSLPTALTGFLGTLDDTEEVAPLDIA